MRAERLGALLLDLDGTLVDSHPALRATYARFVERHGGTPSEAEYERWNGPPLSEIVAGLARAHGMAGDLPSLLAEYTELLAGSYVAEARLASGAEALFFRLAEAGLVAAVVTSAPARLAHAMLAARGVAGRLRTVVCGDEVARGKPWPEPYAEALRRLSLPAGAALAVEDTETGVRAATAAGLRCIGVGPAGSRLVGAGALAAVAGLDEVRAIVEGLLAGAPGRVLAARSIVAEVRFAEPPLDEETGRRVDAVWADSCARRPSLTDGEIVSLVGFSRAAGGIAIEAGLLHYRRYLAQRAGMPLGVCALGVSGVTVVREPGGGRPRLVLGRRAASVTQYPGSWELVPSGGVSSARVGPDGRIDLEGQIREELEEELGTGGGAVISVEALGLVEDLADHVVDACFRIDLEAGEAALRDHLAAHAEYDRLALVEMSEVEAGGGLLLAEQAAGERLAPTVEPLLWLLAARRGAAGEG